MGSTVGNWFKRARGDAAVRDALRPIRAELGRLAAELEAHRTELDQVRSMLGTNLEARQEFSGRGAVAEIASPSLHHDVDQWREAAQPGELEFHKRPNDRSGEGWEQLTAEIWARYGFSASDFEGKTIIDVGAGSRLRTLFFKDARVIAIEPLADQFMEEVPWNDLDQAEAVYAVAAEDRVPQLEETADFLVSLNALDHGFNFEDAIANIAAYMKSDGTAFLSFDQHLRPDAMHPLVLTDEIVREVFERNGLRVERFEERFRYHGGAGPQALNYWLTRGALSP